jgi:hypothetical protein
MKLALARRTTGTRTARFLALALAFASATAVDAQTLREAQVEAAREPVLARLATGGAAVLTDERGTALGTVHDFVLERATGRVAFAIVRSAEDAAVLHLVPYGELAWDAGRGRHVLPSARYAESGVFRPETLVTWTPPPLRGDAGDGSDERTPWMLAGDLSGLRVVRGLRTIGWSLDPIVDVERGSVEFLTVGAGHGQGQGADPFVMPWPALDLNAEGSLELETTLDLHSAPVLPAGSLIPLEAGEFREELYRHYGVRTRGPDTDP